MDCAVGSNMVHKTVYFFPNVPLFKEFMQSNNDAV
jgi:hypothetical protein